MASSGFLTTLECTKFVFGRGSAPDPRWGSLQRSPDLLAGLTGTYTSKGKGREGKEDEGRDMHASISLSIKLNVRLMLVGLPAWRKTEMQNLTCCQILHFCLSPCRQADQHQSKEN